MHTDQVLVGVDTLGLHSSEEGNRSWEEPHQHGDFYTEVVSYVVQEEGTCEEALKFHKRVSIVWGRKVWRLGKHFPERTSG